MTDARRPGQQEPQEPDEEQRPAGEGPQPQEDPPGPSPFNERQQWTDDDFRSIERSWSPLPEGFVLEPAEPPDGERPEPRGDTRGDK